MARQSATKPNMTVKLIRSTPLSILEKGLGPVKIKEPQNIPRNLQSMEQEVLRKLHEVIGSEQISESKLEQFVPRWVIDKSIAIEMENYESGFEEVKLSDLPRCANMILSHNFFVVKRDGKRNEWRQRCRLVLHGNRDKYKHEPRTDTSTVQFPAIRFALSLAALRKFALAVFDIKGAYFQACPLYRDIYMRPPFSFR